MVRLFDTIATSTGSGIYGARDFDRPMCPVFVVYDTPTEGQLYETSTGMVALPDYLSWKCFTQAVKSSTLPTAVNINSLYRYKTSTGEVDALGLPLTPFGTVAVRPSSTINVIKIQNECMFTNQTFREIGSYADLYETNLHMMTELEFKVLKQLITQLDKVRRHYPTKFEKKYSIEELLVCMEAALVDINITSPVTQFWWTFVPATAGQTQINPMNAPNAGVPEIMFNLLVQGALIHALITKGILEVDLNFNYSDSGLTLTYDNASQYSSWYDRLTQAYTQQKTIMKQHWRPRGMGIGTIPEFGFGWFGQINQLMNNNPRYDQVFSTWWTNGNSGRGQM